MAFVLFYLIYLFLDVLDSSIRVDKSASQIKQKKTKDGKESRLGKNQSGSRPNSQQLNFDSMRPHWTLRVIADANLAVSRVLTH